MFCLFVVVHDLIVRVDHIILAALCLAACLAAALATPAGALDYAIDAPEGPDYGKPTSVEVVHTADGGALKNEDISKNAALIPPGFGSASADTLNTGTWLTPNLAPEGMAVGVVYAGYLAGTAQITAAGALALSLGIAIQNFPEGAIISMPLRAEGMKKGRAFWGGVLSGIVEPIGAVLTILAAGIVVPALPYLLSFAAGAMLYVVVEALIPEMSQGRHSNVGTVFFCGRLQRDDGTGCGTGIAHG